MELGLSIIRITQISKHQNGIDLGILTHNVTIFTNDEQNTILRDYAMAREGSRITAEM